MKFESHQKPNNPLEISNLIFKLKEGEGIWFGYDSDGSSQTHYDWVEKTSNGLEFIYTRGATKYDREELESEDDIERVSKEISENPYLRFYAYQKLQNYSKVPARHSQEDDQSIGDYEKYGADKPTWQDIYEEKFMIPKTQQFTLKKIVENLGKIPEKGFGEDTKKLSTEQKRKLQEMASMFENFGECLKHEEELMNSAKGLTELCELAEAYALNECGDWFQQEIVKKDMKELKKRIMEFNKIAKEGYARMQQLGVTYQDIGHILGRYYNLKQAKSLDQHYQKAPTSEPNHAHEMGARQPLQQECGDMPQGPEPTDKMPSLAEIKKKK